MRFHPVLCLAPVRGAAALPTAAQTLHTGGHGIDGKLCVGLACTGSESFGDEAIRIEQNAPRLLFEAVETGQKVFEVEADAPENGLNVSSFGRVGLDTAFPGAQRLSEH